MVRNGAGTTLQHLRYGPPPLCGVAGRSGIRATVMMRAVWSLTFGFALLPCAGCSGDDTNPAAPPVPDAGVLDATMPAPSPDATAPLDDAQPTPLASVRVAHWSPGSPAVDFCLSPHGASAFTLPFLLTQTQQLEAGAPAAGPGLAYPGVSAYFLVTPGQYDVRAVVAGAIDCATGVAPDSTMLPALNAGDFATLALVGSSQASDAAMPLGIVLFHDEGFSTMPQSVALRFINEAPITATEFGPGAGEDFVLAFRNVVPGAVGQAFDSGIPGIGVPVDSLGYATLSPLFNGSVRVIGAVAGETIVEGDGVNLAAGSVVTTTLIEAPSGDDAGPGLQFLVCLDNAGTLGLTGVCFTPSP